MKKFINMDDFSKEINILLSLSLLESADIM